MHFFESLQYRSVLAPRKYCLITRVGISSHTWKLSSHYRVFYLAYTRTLACNSGEKNHGNTLEFIKRSVSSNHTKFRHNTINTHFKKRSSQK